VLAGYALAPLGTFSSPVWVGQAPGVANRLFLVQKQGTVLELDAEGHRLGVLLDIRKLVSHGQEQGLLSMAFDPGYHVNHRLYVDYTDQHGDPQVVAYTVVNGVAIHPQVLLTVFQPYPNHNGGMLLFDRTGMLLVGMGDGGNAGDPQNRAQDLYSDLGKILRIDPRTGAGAPGNPYPQDQRVWALGLRNPWRFGFDSSGYLYVGDSGQNKLEELDVVPPAWQRGANYGWSVFEGTERFKEDQELTPGGHVIVPALTYLHSDGGCSITAGEIYRGRLFPALRGSFVYGDFCQGRIRAVRRTRTGLSLPVDLGVKAEELQAFGHDTRGELLVMTVDTLYRLVPGA
jgi:glucose/arabinose dehydrogenase